MPPSEGESKLLESPPQGHVYPISVMLLAIGQVILSLTSYRGAEKTFKLFAQVTSLPAPDYTSIRKWVLRLGLYELKRKREVRSDWIFIIDMTLELGQAKCLLILGISQTRLTQITQLEKRSLSHQDVEVLTLEVMTQSTGKLIEQILIDLGERVGTPKQIVADKGSDVKKGIELYQAQNPTVISTYDITHQMAALIKNELSSDERYKTFVQQCQLTRQQIQQTELSFLIPPKQRTQARYHNVDILINWGLDILKYESQNDFSLVSTELKIEKEMLLELKGNLPAKVLNKLRNLAPKSYKNQGEFLRDISEKFGEEINPSQLEKLVQTAQVGRRRFLEKLGWLKNYKEDLETYKQMVDLVKLVSEQVKNDGLNQDSQQLFDSRTQTQIFNPRVKKFRERIREYLQTEVRKIPQGETLLGTSDITLIYFWEI